MNHASINEFATSTISYGGFMRPARWKFFAQLLAGIIFGLLAFAPLEAVASETESDGHTWPTKVVTIEQMRALTPFALKVRGVIAKGRVTGPAVLRVHVGADGKVVRVVLLNSSGNPDLDEASLHAMRPMAFKPFVSDGTAMEVTLMVPVHIPASLGRSE
jgi:TonB family protein